MFFFDITSDDYFKMGETNRSKDLDSFLSLTLAYLKFQYHKFIACIKIYKAQLKTESCIKKIKYLSKDEAIHLQKLIESSIDKIIELEERNSFPKEGIFYRLFKKYLRTLNKLDNRLSSYIYNNNKRNTSDIELISLVSNKNAEFIGKKLNNI